MKQESNNAIDLMLRKLGRSGSRLQQNAGNGGAESADAHLDANELSAYAENALPPTTRARYTEHLADCVRCRQIVSQLSQAAGLVIDEAPKTASSSGLIAFLASLFSPIVLRYAVPALGLLVVASIGFIALRSRGSMELAQKREVNFQTPAAEAPLDNGASTSSVPSVKLATKSQPYNVTPPEVEKTAGAKSAEQEKPADEARRQENDQPHEKAATSTDQVATAAPAGSPTETVTVTAAAKPSAVADQKQTTSAVAENKVQTQAAQTGSVQNPKTNEEPAARRVAKEPTFDVAMNASPPLKKGKRDSITANETTKAGDAEEKRERSRADKDQTETISIAGRRFRKTGSVWTDVAYNSSQGSTNVTRGSEQYRALIADEPEIRTIAEQLKGEVIVVWKGHVYRIR
jgi:putative zinc finger protein